MGQEEITGRELASIDARRLRNQAIASGALFPAGPLGPVLAPVGAGITAMQDRYIDTPRAKNWKRGLRGAGYTLAGGLGGAAGGGLLGGGLGYGGAQLAKALGANLSERDIKGITGVGAIGGGLLGSMAGGGYGAYKALPEEVREQAKEGSVFYEQGVKCACEQLGLGGYAAR